jgi:hypothetical protein
VRVCVECKAREDTRNVAADYIIHKDITLSLWTSGRMRFQIPPVYWFRENGICIFTTPFSTLKGEFGDCRIKYKRLLHYGRLYI